jgi:hypothetical protein
MFSPKLNFRFKAFCELRHNGVLRSWCLPEELEEDYPDRHGKVEAVCHPLLWDGQTDP